MKIRHYLLAMVLSCYTVTSFAELSARQNPINLTVYGNNRTITFARDNFKFAERTNTLFETYKVGDARFFQNGGYLNINVTSGLHFKTVLEPSGQIYNTVIYKIPNSPLGVRISVADTNKVNFYNKIDKDYNEVFYYPNNPSGTQGLNVYLEVFILEPPSGKERVYADNIFYELKNPVLIGYVKGIFWASRKPRTQENIIQESPEVPIYLQPFTIRQNIASCTYRSGENLNVKLPTVSKNLFTSVGTEVFGGTFSLNLEQCGVLRQSNELLQENPLRNVKVTFTDATQPNNSTDKLTLTSDSTAKGVKLKIYPADNSSIQSTPVSFGPENRVRGNPNQIDMNYDSRSNTVNQRYVVKYVQDKSQVTAGTVNAVATFTFSYQ